MGAMLDAHYPVAAVYTTWLLLWDEFGHSDAGRRLRERMNLP
jgi:hypothetical protein